MRYYNYALGSDLTTFKKIISPMFVFPSGLSNFPKRNFVTALLLVHVRVAIVINSATTNGSS
jgi:hypothetical protein